MLRTWVFTAALVVGCGSSEGNEGDGTGGAAGTPAAGGTGAAGGTAGVSAGGAGGSSGQSGTFGPVEVLADNQKFPTRLAQNDSTLFWASRGDLLSGMSPTGAVWSVAKTGGVVNELHSGLLGPSGVDVDSTHVYWANFGGASVQRAPLSGGAPEVVVTGGAMSGYSEVRRIDDRVYFADVLGRTVGWVAVDRSASGVITSNVTAPTRIVEGPGTVYFNDQGLDDAMDGVVYRWPIDGMLETLASGLAGPGGIAVDGATVYYSTREDGTVWRHSGATSEPFSAGQPAPFGLAVDGSYLYVTNRVVDTSEECSSDGTVIALPKDGGAPMTLGEGLTCPSTLVVDDAAVYWVENGDSQTPGTGTIKRVEKP